MLERKRKLSFILVITQLMLKKGWGGNSNKVKLWNNMWLLPAFIPSSFPPQSSWFLQLNSKTEKEDSPYSSDIRKNRK